MIPRFIPHTNSTPPDETDTTGQDFFQIGTSPTPPDHSDQMQPPHNPSVVGSIPTGPTSKTPWPHTTAPSDHSVRTLITITRWWNPLWLASTIDGHPLRTNTLNQETSNPELGSTIRYCINQFFIRHSDC